MLKLKKTSVKLQRASFSRIGILGVCFLVFKLFVTDFIGNLQANFLLSPNFFSAKLLKTLPLK